MSEVKTCLETALSLLDGGKNWIQNAMRSLDPKGHWCYCLIGAIDAAATMTNKAECDILFNKANQVIKSITSMDYTSDWNDARGRKPEEVIDLLKSAIVACT